MLQTLKKSHWHPSKRFLDAGLASLTFDISKPALSVEQLVDLHVDPL